MRKLIAKLIESLKNLFKAVIEELAEIERYGVIGKNFKGGEKRK